MEARAHLPLSQVLKTFSGGPWSVTECSWGMILQAAGEPAFATLVCRTHEAGGSAGGDCLVQGGMLCPASVGLVLSSDPASDPAQALPSAQRRLLKPGGIMHASCFLKLAARGFINMQIKQLQIKQNCEKVYSLSSFLRHN